MSVMPTSREPSCCGRSCANSRRRPTRRAARFLAAVVARSRSCCCPSLLPARFFLAVQDPRFREAATRRFSRYRALLCGSVPGGGLLIMPARREGSSSSSWSFPGERRRRRVHPLIHAGAASCIEPGEPSFSPTVPELVLSLVSAFPGPHICWALVGKARCWSCEVTSYSQGLTSALRGGFRL
jgi:hypothetical protein